jgi:hypothetical protein
LNTGSTCSVYRPAHVGEHALRLAPAKPQAAVVVEPAQVAHAMHDALDAVGAGLADLRQHGGFRAAEVGIGGGRPADGDFAQLAGRQLQVRAPLRDRGVGDRDDAHAVGRHRAADAGAGAALGELARAFQLARLDHGHRQAFGGAVGRPQLGIVVHQLAHARNDLRRHRRTRRKVMRLTPFSGLPCLASTAIQRRRTEQLRDAEARDRVVQLARRGACRPRRVHVGDDRAQAQGRIEQGEGREGRQVDAARLHAEGLAQHLDLRDEMAMAIHHALGHAGGAGGEQDRGDLVAADVFRRVGARRARARIRGEDPGAGAFDLGEAWPPPQPRREPTVTRNLPSAPSRAPCARHAPAGCR